MNRRVGFTLVEVMVAMVIAGLVTIAAHKIFVAAADGARALASAREDLDRDANARRWLKATFLSLEPPFAGRANALSFTAWQRTPSDSFEQKAIAVRRDGDRLLATSGADSVVLLRGVRGVTIDYLLEPGADSRWVGEWISPTNAPLAIRIRIAGCGREAPSCVDTLLFLIKARG